jgi:hypothetical protein
MLFSYFFWLPFFSFFFVRTGQGFPFFLIRTVQPGQVPERGDVKGVDDPLSYFLCCREEIISGGMFSARLRTEIIRWQNLAQTRVSFISNGKIILLKYYKS